MTLKILNDTIENMNSKIDCGQILPDQGYYNNALKSIYWVGKATKTATSGSKIYFIDSFWKYLIIKYLTILTFLDALKLFCNQIPEILIHM